MRGEEERRTGRRRGEGEEKRKEDMIGGDRGRRGLTCVTLVTVADHLSVAVVLVTGSSKMASGEIGRAHV